MKKHLPSIYSSYLWFAAIIIIVLLSPFTPMNFLTCFHFWSYRSLRNYIFLIVLDMIVLVEFEPSFWAHLCLKMGKIKDRNSRDLVNTEEIKKR